MKTDEESIAAHNMHTIESALLEMMSVFYKIECCENKYICDIGNVMFSKYCEQLKDIADNGNRI